MRAPLRFFLATFLLALLFVTAAPPSTTTAQQPPTIASITPNFGPSTGGTTVTITGAGLSTTPGATQFTSPASGEGFTNVVCQSTSTCTATTLNVGAGVGWTSTVPIIAVVNGTRGPSGPTFTWYAAPGLSALTPAQGSPSGGNQVVLSGGAFPSAAAALPGPVTVNFGTTRLDLPGCESATACTVTAPPGTGTVNVSITTPGGTSAALPYTYRLTFEYTGAAQSWTVPDGVTQATFSVSGAQGGDVLRVPRGGGLGGQATATLAVTPGDTVTIMVGGAGGSGTLQSLGSGGFNGGGDGSGAETGGGGGGGGASDIRIGGTGLAQRVLVTGGGGGAGNEVTVACPGGAGGGEMGGHGACRFGGAGGNQTGSSGSGQLGQGSAAGGLACGGGGGGYYGGAGACSSGFRGGGGGGSGFGPAGTTFATGVQQGNGLVVITYTPPSTVAPVSPQPSAVAPVSPQPMTITGRVHRVLLPLVSENQIAQDLSPVGGATVEAFVGSTRCGSGVSDAAGRFRLTVAPHPATSGCGREGVSITLRVNGAARGDPLPFRSGGSATVELRLPDRSAPLPIGWP